MSEKWEKVLYKQQKFPDNHVDPSFLSDLQKNVNIYYYSWWEAWSGVFHVTHEISCSVLFVVSFVYIKEDILSVKTILSIITLLTVSCFLLLQFCSSAPWTFNRIFTLEYFKNCVTFLTFGYMFSPVLKTLTETISTDTIYAMVVLMMIAHVLFQDYGTDSAVVSSTLSLNSALFAAVCLASRLVTVMHTFALMVLAVIVFVLLPHMRKQFESRGTGIFLNTLLFFSATLVALCHISFLFTVFFVFSCVCTNVLFPSLFVYLQKYKENIFGPWDEATVKS